jgi:Leucine-rich repeat (LRR) protein
MTNTFNIEEYLNSLPEDTTTIINISNKRLTSLPDLSRFKNLKTLECSYNQLPSLPKLNDNLTLLYCSNNIICDILNTNDIPKVKKMLIILDKFRHLYYSLKYKQQFRQILWKQIREPKIIKENHPDNLGEMFKDI